MAALYSCLSCGGAVRERTGRHGTWLQCAAPACGRKYRMRLGRPVDRLPDALPALRRRVAANVERRAGQ